jgi:Holliday junction DNA helicase RuvA
MIYQIQGPILDILDDSVVVETPGVGYQVFVPAGVLSSCAQGDLVTLFTFHHIREDAQLLFGFLTKEDKQLFVMLTSVSGVGPKVALKLMSVLPTELFIKALLQEDVYQLTQVPGIGKKVAERLVIELKDKVAKLPHTSALMGQIPSGSKTNLHSSYVQELSLALKTLGYSHDEIKQAVNKSSGLDETQTLEQGIKILLKHL